MRSASPFGRRTTTVLVVVVGLSFLSAIFWGIFGPEFGERRSTGADTFSRSALGHRAWKELLRELEIPTVISRYGTGAKAAEGALLVVMEPSLLFAPAENELFETMLRRARRVLVVLPKWEGTASMTEPGWVKEVRLRANAPINDILAKLGMITRIRRPGVEAAGPSWRVGPLGVAPTIARPQLIDATRFQPIVDSSFGTLFGWVNTKYGRVHVLTDPDVLSNHGLPNGDNALFAVRMIEFLREEGQAVIIDETVHGFSQRPSLYRSLFEFPLALATLQVFVTLAVLLWASMGRFGSPLPVRPVLEPGKGFLIGNIASMLRFGGHSRHALSRYLRDAIADAREGLHAPAGLGPREVRAWLDGAAAARGLKVRLSVLEEQVRRAAEHGGQFGLPTLYVARNIHRWREEMIHGRRKPS